MQQQKPKDHNRQLRNSLPFIIRAIAGNMGLKYVPIGPPRTDGKTIYTDPLPLFLDEEGTIIIKGDMYHECSHARYLDFEFLNEQNSSACHTKLRKDIWNSIQDVCDERHMASDYYGCGVIIAQSVLYAIRRGECRTGKKGPADALTSFINYWGCKHINNQDVEPNYSISRDALHKLLGDHGIDKLVALLESQFPFVLTTQQAFRLTDDVLALVKEVSDNQELHTPTIDNQEKPQTTQQSDQDADADPQDDGGGSGSDQDADADPQDDGGGTKGQQGDNSNTNSKGEDTAGTSSSTGKACDPSQSLTGDDTGGWGSGAAAILDDQNVPDGPVINLAALVKEILEQSGDSYRFNPSLFQIVTPDIKNANLDQYNKWKNNINGQTSMLQRRLANEFMTRKRSRAVISHEGRLNGRRLPLAAAGRKDVCSQIIHSTLPSPAVTLVCDVSGSMREKKHALCMQGAIAMCEVMILLQVPFEMCTYHGTYNEGIISIYKSFDQPFTNDTKARLGGSYASGGTPTADALWFTATRLIQRPEKRKILILSTDGDPDNKEHAREVGDIIENSGIELYGIGIGVAQSVMENFCSKCAVLSNPEEIADAFLTALSQRMLA